MATNGETTLPETLEELLLSAEINPAAVEMNDGLLTPAMVKALEVKHGKALAGLVVDKTVATKEKKTREAKAAERERQKLFGELLPDVEIEDPVKFFNDMKMWAQKELDPEEYQELAEMTRKRGKAHKLALKDLVEKYTQAVHVTVKHKGATPNNSSGAKPSDYISKEECWKQIKELERGGKTRNSPEIKALQQRRLDSIKFERRG